MGRGRARRRRSRRRFGAPRRHSPAWACASRGAETPRGPRPGDAAATPPRKRHTPGLSHKGPNPGHLRHARGALLAFSAPRLVRLLTPYIARSRLRPSRAPRRSTYSTASAFSSPRHVRAAAGSPYYIVRAGAPMHRILGAAVAFVQLMSDAEDAVPGAGEEDPM